jgi:hypothetical protein
VKTSNLTYLLAWVYFSALPATVLLTPALREYLYLDLISYNLYSRRMGVRGHCRHCRLSSKSIYCDLHSWLVLIPIYCRQKYKFYCKPDLITGISLHAVRNYFSSHLIKYPSYRNRLKYKFQILKKLSFYFMLYQLVVQRTASGRKWSDTILPLCEVVFCWTSVLKLNSSGNI